MKHVSAVLKREHFIMELRGNGKKEHDDKLLRSGVQKKVVPWLIFSSIAKR
jgi:hypothetical protein